MASTLGVEPSAGAVVGPTPAHDRVLDATLELVARWGVRKTTLGDVARTAGISRATLYRTFPGGKEELFTSLAEREVARMLDAVGSAIDGASDLTGALSGALHAASLHIENHDAIAFVLEHEPELAVPVLGFGETERLLALVGTFIGPHLAPFVDDPERAGWAAEWTARLFLSALVNPTPEWDLNRRDVCERLVSTYLTPALAPSEGRPI